MIRAAILAIGLGIPLGGFIGKALSNANATVLQAAQTGGAW